MRTSIGDHGGHARRWVASVAAAGLLVVLPLGAAACSSNNGSAAKTSSTTTTTGSGSASTGTGSTSTGTGTSTGTSSGTSSSTSPTQELATYSGNVTMTTPGPAFAASKAKGKTVMLAVYTAANPALNEADTAFKAAMQHVGVTVDLCDGKGTPTGDNACFQQGISQHVAAIEAQGSSPKTYASIISAANSANIPILEGADSDPRTTPLTSGLAANAGPPWKLVGKLMADWILKDSGGKGAHILYESIPDVDGAIQEQAAFAATIKANCSTCTVTTKGITVADWASQVAPATSSALQADPSINYVVPGFDPMINFAGPAVKQLGKASQEKFVTSGGSFEEMSQMAKSTLIYADVGIDYPALGYLQADQVLRAIVGAPQEKGLAPPVKVFTRTNVGSVNLSQTAAKSGSFYTTTTALQSTFYKAWSGQ